MQMILNSARIARTSGNRARALDARHISAAKPQAFVNDWRARCADSRLLSLLRQGQMTAIGGDCNEGGETLYTGAFEIEPALAVSA